MLPQQITSLTHPVVKHLVKLRQSRSYRKEKGQCLVCNSKTLQQIVFKRPLLELFSLKNHPCAIKATRYYIVTEGILKKITGHKQPEGVAATVEIPSQPKFLTGRYFLGLFEISDPGNMGTLLRTALALGFDGAFLTENCVDPLLDKALSSSKGAALLLPWQQISTAQLMQHAAENALTPYVADTKGAFIETTSMKPPLVLIVSNESRGPSPLFASCKRITIPLTTKMESLNVAVAGGILMYHAKNPSKHRL